MTTPERSVEEICFNPRAGGKEILSDKMIVEEVRKGDNYVVWKSPKTTVHIIPDGKLREMFQAERQKREEMVEAERERIAKYWYEHIEAYVGRRRRLKIPVTVNCLLEHMQTMIFTHPNNHK